MDKGIDLIYKLKFRGNNSLPITISIITSLLICLFVFSSCGGSNIPTVAQYTLTIYSDTTMPVNENTFVGAGMYKEGSKVNIRANPETGWDFIEWTGDIDTVTSQFSSNTDIVMNGNYEIAAHFTYPIITHSISNVVFNPEQPAKLSYGEQVEIRFNYETNDKTAVYVFMHPLINGSVTPGYLYSGTNFYHPWQNKGEISFTISSQPKQITVDQIRFQIMNIVQTKILYEIFIPVSYTFQ